MKTALLAITATLGVAAGICPAQPATPAAPPPASTQPAASPQPTTAAPALAPVPEAPRPPASVRNVPYAGFKMELPMIQRNVIAGITGRMGNMAMDVQKNILYVAATGAGTIEVHNVANSKSIQSLPNQPGATGLAFMPATHQLVASCATDGSCRVFNVDDTGQLAFVRALNFAGETGPLILDPAGKLCWIGHGVFVSSFDPADGAKKSELSLEGIGRPVAIAAEHSGQRLFAVTTPANEVVVIDRAKNSVSARWPLSENAPGAIAIDEGNNRIFVATRTHARLIVLDTADGREVAKLEGPEEPGSIWYDPYLRKIYVAGNKSQVRAYGQVSPDTYQILATETTAPGSRTSLLIPEHRRLIVSAPNLGDDDTARLFVYQIGP